MSDEDDCWYDHVSKTTEEVQIMSEAINTTCPESGPESASDSYSDSEDISEVDPDSRAGIHNRISRLADLIPKIFLSNDQESYILHHQDLSNNNILLTPSHSLSDIIDWECVHTVPTYLGFQLPNSSAA